MIKKMLSEIKKRTTPEIYFTMDVESCRSLKTDVPTTYFIDYPLELPDFCFKNSGLHFHIDIDHLDEMPFEEIYELLKKKKEKIELKTRRKIKYFRPGCLISHPKLDKVVKKLKMKIIGTNVRYYTAWLPKKKIVFIVHSYNSRIFIKLLILYLKLFHPFGKWKTLE